MAVTSEYKILKRLLFDDQLVKEQIEDSLRLLETTVPAEGFVNSRLNTMRALVSSHTTLVNSMKYVGVVFSKSAAIAER